MNYEELDIKIDTYKESLDNGTMIVSSDDKLSYDVLLDDKMALEQLFESINKEFFQGELNPVVINTEPVKESTLGHYFKDRWKRSFTKIDEEGNEIKDFIDISEININPIHFDEGPLKVIITLHHEMIHHYNGMNDIKDASKNGKHNKRFEEGCIDFDLYYEEDSKLGFTTPIEYDSQSERWQKWYDKVIEEFNLTDSFITAYNPVVKVPKEKVNLVFICRETGLSFKVTKKVYDQVMNNEVDLSSPYINGGEVYQED